MDPSEADANGAMRRVGGLARMLLAATLAASAVGCATPQLPVQPAGAEPRSSWLGRFAATWTVASTPPSIEQVSGRFTLVDGGGRTELEIFSPLGQTLARAVTDPTASVLETADGRRFEAQNPEALTEQVLGWRIPVQRLPAWFSERSAEQANDSGWKVTIDARDQGLPSRLTLAWPQETVPTSWRRVTIRLILDERQVNGPPRQ